MARRGTVIIADNVVRDGAVIDEGSDDPRMQGVRAFYDLAGREPCLRSTGSRPLGKRAGSFRRGVRDELTLSSHFGSTVHGTWAAAQPSRVPFSGNSVRTLFFSSEEGR